MNSRFLSFNFYTDDRLYCDQLYGRGEEIIPEKGIIFKRKACYNPLFYENLSTYIVNNNPELIIITTHGDNKNSYLHTDFLQNYFNKLPKKYILLTHKQSKHINMSIYIQPRYENNYQYVSTDEYLLMTNINSIAITINSDFGKLVFIGIDKNELIQINENQLKTVVKKALESYIDKSINFYFIMAHVHGYDEKDYYAESGYYNKNGYNIIQNNEEYIETFNKHVGQITTYDITKKNPKILSFSWNTDKTPLCDQNYQNSMSQHMRTRWYGSDQCYNPLFFITIKENIMSSNPDIVTFTSEGDLEKGTFFHSEFLPNNMSELKYTLLENDKITNNETMRMSIYVRNDIIDIDLLHINKSLFSYNEHGECDMTIYRKAQFLNQPIKMIPVKSTTKAIVKYVNTSAGIIAFTSIQIPHDSTPENINKCLQRIKKDLLSSGKISYIFLIGDFAYDNLNDNDFIYKYKELEEFDEGDEESLIEPNYALKPISVSQRQNFQLTPDRYIEDVNMDPKMTWHDRIYYKMNDLTTHEIICIKYENVIGFPMLQDRSNHLGVLGIYELIPV